MRALGNSDPSALLGSLSGEEKAAILVVVLGEKVSGRMFGHLSKREVAKIARRIAELGPIKDDVGEAVLEEYYVRALDTPRVYGGPDIARKMLHQAAISEEIVDQLIQDSSAGHSDVLGPLLEAPPDVLAAALQDEHPQTTALVLLHLPPDRAGVLLAALPEAARKDTVLRMVNVKPIRDEIIDQVAASLHERLTTTKKAQDAQGGIARTASVLGTMARSETKKLLDQLEEENPEPVQALREQLYTFDSLLLADDRGIQELLRQVDTSKLALALSGADEALMNRFLSNLSARAAGMLKDEMEFLGQPNAADQAAAQKELLGVALNLESEGALNFVAQAAAADKSDG